MNKKKKTRMTQNDIKTAKRLLKYVTEKYKLQFILVFICILISAVATTAVSLSSFLPVWLQLSYIPE